METKLPKLTTGKKFSYDAHATHSYTRTCALYASATDHRRRKAEITTVDNLQAQILRRKISYEREKPRKNGADPLWKMCSSRATRPVPALKTSIHFSSFLFSSISVHFVASKPACHLSSHEHATKVSSPITPTPKRVPHPRHVCVTANACQTFDFFSFFRLV